MEVSERQRHFQTTRWSLVQRAADPQHPEARRALAALCEDYWYPLYAYMRRSGCSPNSRSFSPDTASSDCSAAAAWAPCMKPCRPRWHAASPSSCSRHDFGRTVAGHPYFVMELVDGTDLQRVTARVSTMKTTNTVRRQPRRSPDLRGPAIFAMFGALLFFTAGLRAQGSLQTGSLQPSRPLGQQGAEPRVSPKAAEKQKSARSQGLPWKNSSAAVPWSNPHPPGPDPTAGGQGCQRDAAKTAADSDLARGNDGLPSDPGGARDA